MFKGQNDCVCVYQKGEGQYNKKRRDPPFFFGEGEVKLHDLSAFL